MKQLPLLRGANGNGKSPRVQTLRNKKGELKRVREKSPKRKRDTKRARYLKQRRKEYDHFRCVNCGDGLWNGVKIEVDHIVPIVDGGEVENLHNMQTLCVPCHSRKSIEDGTLRLNRYQAEILLQKKTEYTIFSSLFQSLISTRSVESF